MRFLIPVLALVLLVLIHVPDAQAQGCSGGFAGAGGCSGSQGGSGRAKLFSGGLLHRSANGGLFARRRSAPATATVQVIQVERAPELPAAPPAPKAMP